jgi:hypothetical protein
LNEQKQTLFESKMAKF